MENEKEQVSAAVSSKENSSSEEAKDATASSKKADDTKPKQKKFFKSKRNVTICVVIAVIVVAGVGGLIWHEQPSFCNAICHVPMDGYLQTYEATPGQAATDKYNNKVSNAKGMLSAVHRTNNSKATCLGCHQPILSQQISEGGSWLTGNYTLVSSKNKSEGHLSERSTTQLSAAKNEKGDAFCLRSGCHVNSDGSTMTREDLTKLTQVESDDPSVVVYNPHSWRHGQQECSECHKAHRASVLTCTQCHATMEVPEGWISSQEAKNLDD